MIAQGVLPFCYESEPTTTGMTALAGLPAYVELAMVCGLADSIGRQMRVCAGQKQGWSDVQIVTSLVLLNLAGGDCVDDLRILEADEGFSRVLRRVELHGLSCQQRREQLRRWRKERRRAVPSASAVFRYLSAFHDAGEEKKRIEGRAFIPAASQHLQSLSWVNRDMLRFGQCKAPQTKATLDQDATLAETNKRQALYCYQGNKAYQPLTVWWAEQDMVVHSEFRDGNVPAGFEALRVLREALGMLPGGVDTVYYRGDTASYQQELLRYCAEGRNERFGVIEFAVGVDVTQDFKRAVTEVKESEWHPLERAVEGERVKTDQEWAEVCFVPNWVGHHKGGPEYRFLAIREPLRQRELPGLEPPQADQLPFPTLGMGEGGRTVRYKLFGMVTNRHDLTGDEVITWHRGRCGKSEEVHAAMKNDLAGGQLPSGEFGVNAAWWGITVLAYNLNSLMKRLAMPEGWASKRLKAVRFGFINLAGRVVAHARRLIIRLGADQPAYGLLLEVRQRVRALRTQHRRVAEVMGPP